MKVALTSIPAYSQQILSAGSCCVLSNGRLVYFFPSIQDFEVKNRGHDLAISTRGELIVEYEFHQEG